MIFGERTSDVLIIDLDSVPLLTLQVNMKSATEVCLKQGLGWILRAHMLTFIGDGASAAQGPSHWGPPRGLLSGPSRAGLHTHPAPVYRKVSTGKGNYCSGCFHGRLGSYRRRSGWHRRPLARHAPIASCSPP